jgi:hypothetical protein
MSDRPSAIAIHGVQERDVDLLMLEEFTASEAFWRWFISQTVPDLGRELTLIAAAHGVTDSSGESDLELRVAAAHGRRTCVLIENKVNVEMQPQQVERYKERGQNYLRAGSCEEFRTVLIAPTTYLLREPGTHGFDVILSYEAVVDWFTQANLGARAFYKMALLKTAISKVRDYKGDGPVTAFWEAYSEMAAHLIPDLRLPSKRGRPSGSTWITFKMSAPKTGISLRHKLNKGFVDLEFAGLGKCMPEFQAAVLSFLEPGMSPEKAEQSSAIRILVPPLKITDDFSKQMPSAEVGQLAAQRLYRWFLKYHDRLPNSIA